MTDNDAYGHTLKVQQHQQLVEATKDIPGIVVRRPTQARSRFEFVVVEATSVVLMPFRYATDRSRDRRRTKLPEPVSELRRSLLGTGHEDTQHALNFTGRDDTELEAEYAEEQAIQAQLARFGRTVTIAYGSNPTVGVFDLGWCDLQLVDEAKGTLHWGTWEPLLLTVTTADGRQVGDRGPRTALAGVDRAERVTRFDDDIDDDDFQLVPRSPLDPAPTSESGAKHRFTADEGQPGA